MVRYGRCVHLVKQKIVKLPKCPSTYIQESKGLIIKSFTKPRSNFGLNQPWIVIMAKAGGPLIRTDPFIQMRKEHS